MDIEPSSKTVGSECMICADPLPTGRAALRTCVFCNAIGIAYLTQVLPARFIDEVEVSGRVYTTRKASPLGAALRYLRQRDGLSQKELAERLGCGHSTLSKWESGDRTPTGSPATRLKAMIPVVPLEVLL